MDRQNQMPTVSGDSGPKPPMPRATTKSARHCRYFATNGCRVGDACPYLHDPAQLEKRNQISKAKTTSQQGSKAIAAEPDEQLTSKLASEQPIARQEEGRQYMPPPVDNARIVQRPTPQAQADDPREFQIQQLRRRFSPREKIENDGTALVFKMTPSDPDFPFDMEALECVLHIPRSFPHNRKPCLEVKNKEMGRGHQINVERGFDRLVEQSPQATLLGLINALDRQLESLLTEKKAETIKILPNFIPTRSLQPKLPQTTLPPKPTKVFVKQLETYTQKQRRDAEARRQAETYQLEARLGRLPLYSKSPDGTTYMVPIQPRQHEDLPVPLQSVKTVKLHVPLLYPLEHCRVEIQDVARNAAIKTEKGFERRVKESSETSLMGHVNYLGQHMHVFATEPEPAIEAPRNEPEAQELANMSLNDQQAESDAPLLAEENDYRSHIKVIPRPPEWTATDGEDSSGSGYSDSYDSGDELTDNEGKISTFEAVSEGPERGVSLSFPSLELHGIELLELDSLYLTVKCERCKEKMDISNIRSAASSRSESCTKCASTLSVGFRRELMHQNCIRAGYLDLDGCTVLDMLPSNFVLTCSACSTVLPAPGIVSVRGESSLALCRECHHRMTFKIPDLKFLLVSASAKANAALPPKRPKEKLGIVTGQELFRRGRCTHYSKSYRWFRFNCCSKVFACDKCHDEVSDHPNEHANRMICGFCSREQNYRPEDCGICHAVLVGRKGGGFWEGGKGTRDKTKMSRKDPRKYKRRGGSKVGSQGLGGQSFKPRAAK